MKRLLSTIESAVVAGLPAQPAVAGGGWGGELAGVEVDTPVAVTAASASAAGAQAIVPGAGPIAGAVYPGLPAGGDYRPTGGNACYACGETWVIPSYGADSLQYRAASCQ